jgi:hypothetical protein
VNQRAHDLVYRLIFALLVVTGSAVDAETIDSYRFRRTFEGWPKTTVSSGVVVVRGSAYRLLVDPSDDPLVFDAVLSEDGEHELALNRVRRSFFDLGVRPPGFGMSSRFRLLPSPGAAARQATLRVEPATGEALEGHPTRKTSLILQYTVDVSFGAHSVSGTVEATATFWMTNGIALALPSNLRPGFRTGFQEVDERVAEALAGLEGFPLKQELRITSKVDGEAPATERIEIVIDSFTTSGCDAACFQVPAGFVRREPPVVSSPAVESSVPIAAPEN